MTSAAPTTPDQLHPGVHAGATAIDTQVVEAADHAPSATAAAAGVAPSATAASAGVAPAAVSPAPAAAASAAAPQEEAEQAMQAIEGAVAKSSGANAPEALAQLREKAGQSSYIEGAGAFCHMTENGGEFYGLNASGDFSSLPFKGTDQGVMEKKFAVFQASRGYPTGTAALPSRFEVGAQSLTPSANAAAELAANPPPKIVEAATFPAPPDETKVNDTPGIERDHLGGGGRGGFGG